jgi:chemotaxis protein MotB
MERQKTQAVTVESDGRRLTVRLAASRFFEPGLAVLQPDAMPVLDAVAVVLRDMEKQIRVEGHTDESTLAGARFRTNWDLSASRAATVTAYLEQAHRIPATRLSAVGFGSTRPIVPNDTPENRELNRRIAFVIEVQPQDPLSLATP